MAARRHPVRMVAPLAFAALLASCQPVPIEVELSFDGGRPAGLFFTHKDWWPGRDAGACVEAITVYRRAAPELIGDPPAPVLWSVVVQHPASAHHCVDVQGFVYGATPAGFVVDTPAHPLQSGVVYELETAALGGVERYFTVEPGRSGRTIEPS